MEGAKLKGFRRSGIAVVGVLQVLQRCRRIDGQRENKLNRVGREGRPRKMRPSLNGLDETRRANQSDSREAASSARNVFDVARFTVYNRHLEDHADVDNTQSHAETDKNAVSN